MNVANLSAGMSKPIIPKPLPYILYADYNDYVDKNGLTHNVNTFIGWALYAAAWSYGAVLPWADDVHFGCTVVTSDVGNAKVTAYYRFNYSGNADVKIPGTSELTFTASTLTWMDLTLDGLIGGFVGLCGAESKTALTPKNIESYFKAARFDVDGDRLLKTIQFLGSITPDISGDLGVQAKIRANNWLKYRFTETSSGDLCDLAFNEIGPMIGLAAANVVAPLNTMGLIAAAKNNPWDKAAHDAIPDKVKAITWIYLEATNRLPPNWYQGKRAYTNLSAALAVKYKALFVKTIAEIADVAGVNALGPGAVRGQLTVDLGLV